MVAPHSCLAKGTLGLINRCPLFTMLLLAGLALLPARSAESELINHITIDGTFDDWAGVPSYFDAVGTTYHTGTLIPDVHDTDHELIGDIPSAVVHPDVDILEYKFTHDENNLYAYFRATGEIGRTQEYPLSAGRYYVIVTIDVDNDDSTGYWLHEGGYYPTSDGYDMNIEAEFYDGQLNTAHYLSHDALTDAGLTQDFKDLTSGEYPSGYPGPYTPGFVQPDSGDYEHYTQWVYHDNDTLTLVEDRGPVVPGIMTLELSGDGHEIEMCAPFKGLLNDSMGDPNMALGKTIDISFSLEASGELAGGEWASDTGDPIIGYFLEFLEGDANRDRDVDFDDFTELATHYTGPGGSGKDWTQGDFNGDGDVDFGDFTEIATHYTGASGYKGVPEPSTLILLTMGAVGLLPYALRRRKRAT